VISVQFNAQPASHLSLSSISVMGESPEESDMVLAEVKQLFDEGANSVDTDRSLRRYTKCIQLAQLRSMPTPFDVFRLTT
jgi:hypothetical protein